MLAENVCDALDLERVYFVPCGIPPHKTFKNLLSGEKRLAMIQKAIKGNQRFSVSNFEIKRNNKSYSIDTVNYFRKKFGTGYKIYFLIGQDSAESLSQWKDIEDLCKKVCFIAVGRPGVEQKSKSCGVRYIDAPEVEVSSSDIRKKIKSGKSVKYFLPDGVIQYINKQKLYQP